MKRCWTRWDDTRVEELRRLAAEGLKAAKIADLMVTSRGAIYVQASKNGISLRNSKDGPGRKYKSGGKLKRVAAIAPGARSVRLAADHPAALEGRTLFPTTVVSPANSPRVFVSGHNQRKIGKVVVKGRWKGMPIFCLTLEERKTCPPTCLVWHECYGNNMHLARRHRHGPELEHKIIDEALELAKQHPQGFVVRLHMLGDFYSVEYVELWHELMKLVPTMHVFGFTAHQPTSTIGQAILRWLAWSDAETDARAWIRFSGTDAHGLGSQVIDSPAESQHVVCPAMTHKTDCCGTCGLCWTMDRPVEFLRHGWQVTADA
jgi:hypothetical protein